MSNAANTANQLSPAARRALDSIARNGRNCVGRKVLQGGKHGCLVHWSPRQRLYNLTGEGALVLRALRTAEKAAA